MTTTNSIAAELMSIEECATYLGFTVTRLRKMCFKKQIPYKKFGRTVRFYKPDIVKWIEKNNVN